jgi:hypothetical protein
MRAYGKFNMHTTLHFSALSLEVTRKVTFAEGDTIKEVHINTRLLKRVDQVKHYDILQNSPCQTLMTHGMHSYLNIPVTECTFMQLYLSNVWFLITSLFGTIFVAYYVIP